uniref:Uncharacterized protein n=2 Tax=Lepeophtheirus salmonis TaxID=72036 RepID=A0A0K2TA68_LEPSM
MLSNNCLIFNWFWCIIPKGFKILEMRSYSGNIKRKSDTFASKYIRLFENEQNGETFNLKTLVNEKR